MPSKRSNSQAASKSVANGKKGHPERNPLRNACDQTRNNAANWEIHFNPDDLESVKNLTKCRDLNGMPLIIGAVVLRQKATLEALLKHGYDINESDKNNATPLYWAAKLKSLEMIKLLLEKSADPNIPSSQGENAICLALGSADWDETSYLSFCKGSKCNRSLDVDAVNRNGFSLLHLAVRRNWIKLVDFLIANGVKVNNATVSGVTPLMLACYRNNARIVDRLLDHGAHVMRRNLDGFTALCYALSAAVSKQLHAPFKVIDRLQAELMKSKVDLKAYLKERLKLLGIAFKERHTDQPTPEHLLQNIFTFVMAQEMIPEPFCFLAVDLTAGKLIKDALEKLANDKDNIIVPLVVLNTMFKHCSFTEDVNKIIFIEFIKTGCFSSCLKVLRTNEHHDVIVRMVLTPILFYHGQYDPSLGWYEGSKVEIAAYLPKFEEELDKGIMDDSDKFQQIINSRLIEFKKFLLNTHCTELLHENQFPDHHSESKHATKKSKKRKSLKPKVLEIKSLEKLDALLQEANESLKASEKVPLDPEPEATNEDTLYVTAIKMAMDLLQDDDTPESSLGQQKFPERLTSTPLPKPPCRKDDTTTNKQKKDDRNDWIDAIRKLPFQNSYSKMLKYHGGVIGLEGKYNPEIAEVDIIIKYLEGLLGVIVNRYRDAWLSERPKEEMQEAVDSQDACPSDAARTEDEEKEQLRILHREFYNLTRNVKESYHIDQEACYNILKELEKYLMTHSIRGQTIIDCVAELELVKMHVKMPKELEATLAKYMEKVMADIIPQREDIQITFKQHLNTNKPKDERSMGDYVYLNEMSHLPARRCLCSDPSPLLNPSIFSTWEESDDRDSSYYRESRSTLLDQWEQKDSKWCTWVRCLEVTEDSHSLLNGAIRVINSEKRNTQTCPLRGSFSLIEIGLSQDSKPLAVKILSKNDPFAVLLKEQIDPLLSLRHKYILPYHTCEFDGNLLILATPLCEYNLGQYVLKMCQPQKRICSQNIIRQLLNGLMFLHDQDEPIVHGNLKPSNILIDLMGTVKVAEFGIHKAMLTDNKLPHSSIIWLATELYKLHKENKPLECTCSSDIQVAGMLVHFANNYGSHPFGKEVAEIVNNIEEAMCTVITSNMELNDLLGWMLLGEPAERPTIHQVLSHIFFWPKQKKWTYILLCAGLGVMSTIPMDIIKLHNSLDSIAMQESILGNGWVQTAKKHYPEASLANAADTPSGLLKFIKDVVENNLVLHSCEREKNFSSFVLTAFPHFVISLYRMIENTEWSEHRVFMPFHNIVDY